MNITQLSQGSLNGLRRQTSECLENAYRKGYEDGKNEPRKVKAVNVEDTSEYQIGYTTGYDMGYNDGYDYEKGKLDGLEEFENLFINEHDYERFFEDTYGSKDPDYNLYDLVAKYGAKKVVDDLKKWEEKKKDEEESIKVGDIVYYGEEMLKAIILDIFTEQGVTFAIMLDENGVNVNEELSGLKVIEHTNEVEQLLNKLKGEKE